MISPFKDMKDQIDLALRSFHQLPSKIDGLYEIVISCYNILWPYNGPTELLNSGARIAESPNA